MKGGADRQLHAVHDDRELATNRACPLELVRNRSPRRSPRARFRTADLRGRAIVALIWFRLASRTEDKYKQSRTVGDDRPGVIPALDPQKDPGWHAVTRLLRERRLV